MHADNIHMTKMFRSFQVRALFIGLTQEEMIHRWLESTSINIEHIISNTIITLARMEGMIDENNEIRSDED